MNPIKEDIILGVLKADSQELLKKVLKVKSDEDYFKVVIDYLEKSIFNYKECYTEFIYKLIEILEIDIRKTDNYLEKFNKIILFRNHFSNIYQVLYKRTKKNNDCYSTDLNILLALDSIDTFFDNEVKECKIKGDFLFEEILDFLGILLKKKSLDNFDIINRLLNSLEKHSSKVTEDTLDRTSSILTLKKYVGDRINETDKYTKKEKSDANNLSYIYQVLDKIGCNISNNVSKDTSFQGDKGSFKYLVKHLTSLINDFSFRNVSSIYKSLELLDASILNLDDDHLEDLEAITRLRISIINEIKATKKTTRNSHKRYYYLKDIANRLENIEMNIAYNVKSSLIVDNYNIIRYIMFELENMSYSESLIKNNPYLINAYNVLSDNVLNEVVDRLLTYIKDPNISYKKICYYNKMLKLLVSNKVIYISDECLKNNIKKVNESCNENSFIKSWCNNIISALTKEESIDENDINNMYNVIIPRYESSINKKTTPSKDFIFTVDEDISVNKDDAISISKISPDLYNLKIYISDPTSMFNMNSFPIKCARNNCETIYLEDKKIDMFHPGIIKNYLSLDEGKNRNVKVYNFFIDNLGKLVAFEITKECPKISKNYSYEEFNSIFDKTMSSFDEELVNNLSHLSSTLFKNKYNNLDGFCGDSYALRMVASFMIYTNSKVAEYFAKEGYPFIYRYYDESDNSSFKNVVDAIPESDKDVYKKYLEEISYERSGASYSTSSRSHDALGLGYYTHLTSPNRRYADILANCCIDKFYFGNPNTRETIDFENFLNKEVEYLNDRIVGINSYYEDYSKHVLKRTKQE